MSEEKEERNRKDGKSNGFVCAHLAGSKCKKKKRKNNRLMSQKMSEMVKC